jgi:hypothetical protein
MMLGCAQDDLKSTQTGDPEFIQSNFNRSENWLKQSGFKPSDDPAVVLDAVPELIVWAVCLRYASKGCFRNKLIKEITDDFEPAPVLRTRKL